MVGAISDRIVLIACLSALTWCCVRAQHCQSGVECIPLQSCSELHRQLQNGHSPQLISLLRSLHCGFQDGNNPKVCCAPEYLTSRISNSDNSPLGGTGNTGSGNTGSNGGGGFTGNRTPVDPVTLLPSTSVCGIQNKDRIIGGTVADLDEHPWMVLLRYDKPRGSGFYCGGVLISSRYVLTAAHCVKGSDLPSSWKLSQVRLGEWNTSSLVDCDSQGDCNQEPVDVPIEQIIPHEQYDPNNSNQHNDLALIRLSRNVQFTYFIKPICLPISNALKRSDFNGYTMEVAGWGKTETRSESEVKLKVRVPVMTRSECARVYQRADRVIGPTQLCAGGVEGQDSCRGDSGGALMGYTPSAENWLVTGIVSYGPSPCGTPGWPGVYTRVGAYVDWILSKMHL